VCYGGVSLCVYMHGITKELHRLVRASLARNGALTGSELVYRDLLGYVTEQRGGVRLDVVIDVVTGTSAGGINGIYLSKALAGNRSQDALRNLWLEKADIKQLLRGWRRLPVGVRVWPLLLQALKKSPLRGEDISLWLYDALKAMDTRDAAGDGAPGTLVPDGHVLQLFVTMTDFSGYDRPVRLTDPPLVNDRRHRHWFEFRYGEGEDLFTSDYNPALAFAARATSCFPGVFPPVSVGVFNGYLRKRAAALGGKLVTTFFRPYELAEAPLEDTYFIDGGVLDNRPFGLAIGAIRAKPADVEVDRKLLYLEPDPAEDPSSGAATPATGPPRKPPETVAAVLGAVSGIPRKEPILDDLLEVARLNERVQRLRDVIKTDFDRVGQIVQRIVNTLGKVPTEPDSPELREWNRLANEEAQKQAGLEYATYVRSKISGAVDRYAATACAICNFPTDSNQAFFVREVVRCWVEQMGLFEPGDGPSEGQLELLRYFDFDYGVRRLRFVIAAVVWWYDKLREPGIPSRKELDAVNGELWEAVHELQGAMTAKGFGDDICRQITECFSLARLDGALRTGGTAEDFARKYDSELLQITEELKAELNEKLDPVIPTLYVRLDELTKGWHEERRWDLLVRWLGFPIWDVLLYPIQSLSDAGEVDAVEVVRMSPRDAKLLEPAKDRKGRKLDGVKLGHFAAFLERSYRENDYLWGRLDAAERLLRLVLPAGDEDPQFEKWCGKAFLAILDEEENDKQPLAKAKRLIAELREQSKAL
jgi:patatin-related protein